MDDRINGKTKIIGLIGNPVEHTISPQLHNTLSSMLGIDVTYIPFKVERDNLESAVKGLKACNLLGFNATIPFKQEILKYVDDYTPEVKLMGSANTVKNKHGRLYAYNTDAEGFIRSYEEQNGEGFENKCVVMLGAGGTARSLAVKIALKGAVKLYLVNRTIQKAKEIADTVNSLGKRIAEAVNSSGMEQESIIKGCNIIVNTTSLGMYPNVENSPLSENIMLDSKQIVCDVIYNPGKTKLLERAESLGCRTMNGLGMLFYQGVSAYEIWMDIKIPDAVISTLWDEFTKYFDK